MRKGLFDVSHIRAIKMVKNYDSKEVRTVSVEKVLEPFVTQIALLVDRNDSADRPKGLSQNKFTILDLIKNVRFIYLVKL